MCLSSMHSLLCSHHVCPSFSSCFWHFRQTHRWCVYLNLMVCLSFCGFTCCVSIFCATFDGLTLCASTYPISAFAYVLIAVLIDLLSGHLSTTFFASHIDLFLMAHFFAMSLFLDISTLSLYQPFSVHGCTHQYPQKKTLSGLISLCAQNHRLRTASSCLHFAIQLFILDLSVDIG